MNITNVCIRLVNNNRSLLAFASILIDDCFVIHGIKIIKTEREFIVAMPSQEIYDRCFSCLSKNTLRQRYCGECGKFLDRGKEIIERNRLYRDICHPINLDCREKINKMILDSFWEKKKNYEKKEIV